MTSHQYAGRLAIWTALGIILPLLGVWAALTNNRAAFFAAVPLAAIPTFMLGTGLWMKWPRG